MKGIFVDKSLSNFDDILALTSSMLSKFSCEGNSGHYLKFWRFFEENNNPETIRTASINLTDPLIFKKNEGYIGILFYTENYAENRLPSVFDKIEGIDNVTPKGVSNAFTFNDSNEVKFGISLLTGKNCGGLIKAIMLTRAFELESLLNKHPVVLNGIYSGIWIKSKKIRKSEKVLLEINENKGLSSNFMQWIFSHQTSSNFPLFSEAFLNKNPSKLFLNPFGVSLHKPKVSSLSLKNVKSKLQEKESLEANNNLEDLENEDIRYTIRNELTLEYYNDKVSEMYPGLFVSGSVPANNKAVLCSLGITHIYNFAGNICENYFPSDFVYKKFYIKDSNNYDIESLFYPIFSEVQQILHDQGKVLFHCVQGVSRSVAFCIGYYIFSTNIPYEEALEKCKNIRKISSPNIGFQVQLIWWYKRLYESYSCVPISPRVFVICSYDPDSPSLIVAKLLMQEPHEFVLDSRSIFILHTSDSFFLWKGSLVSKNNFEKYYEAARFQIGFLQKYEKCKDFVEVSEGQESDEFWKLWKTKGKIGINSEWNEWFIDLQDSIIEDTNGKLLSSQKTDTNSSKKKLQESASHKKIVTLEKFKGQNTPKALKEITPSDSESKNEETESKYEKVSNFPQTIEDSYSKDSAYESEKENFTEKALVEDPFKLKLFIYPETQGITVFDAEELSENNLICLCTKTKIFVWKGESLDLPLQNCKAYASEVTKSVYSDTEVEVFWERFGEETEEFLSYFA